MASVPLSDSVRQRLAPTVTVDRDIFGLVSSSAGYGLSGRFASAPLRLHDTLLYALLELELATRPLRVEPDAAAFYDSVYDLVAPYHDRAAHLAECQYEAVACWLAVFAKPYLGAEEREARRLADLLHVVVQEDGWREPYRTEARSLAQAVFNRPSSGQAEFAVAAAASDYGRRNLERVSDHVFRALVEAEGEDAGWSWLITSLARFLAQG